MRFDARSAWRGPESAKPRSLVVPHGPPAQEEAATEAAAAAECEVEAHQVRPNRISWARLLKRVFEIDMLGRDWAMAALSGRLRVLQRRRMRCCGPCARAAAGVGTG